ncbi:MAG TPA: AAA family ATPase [Cellvibrio sp.]|nr:AAA family ATPase [Cellvibrio sp.]
MLEPIIKKFRIHGLHGYKNVEIEFTAQARIIIAENGAGKTTILAALYAFLKRDFYRLAKIRFESIECEIAGNPSPLRIVKSQLLVFETMGTMDSEIEKLSRFTANPPSAIRDSIMELNPEDISYFPNISLLHDIYMASPYDHEEFTEILKTIRGAVVEMPKELSETAATLNNLVGKLQFLYLPTYRRVELSAPKTPRRPPNTRWSRENHNDDGIRYGLRDVQDRLADILSDIQRYSNSQYRTISAAIIDDALGGKINPDTYQSTKLPDIEALRLFFSRVESDQSKTNRIESLKNLYETGDIHNNDQLVLRYFLSKLEAVVDRTKQLETNVEKFVEQVNVYLSLSSDEKILTYDSNLMRVVVRNTFNDEEIDLEVLSSGEKQIISLFSHLYLEPGQKIILIDEPELSLSLDWQRRLLPDVINSPGCAQLLAITHSPFIFENDLDRYAGPMKIWKQEEAKFK